MGGILPLPDHLGAWFNAAAAKHGVRIAISPAWAISRSRRFVATDSPP
jgi:hypothetical protein